VDPSFEDDTWAPETDRQEVDDEARRQWREDVKNEPVTIRSFLSALPMVLGTAAVSLFFGIVFLSRSGPVSKSDAVFFFALFGCLAFVVIRGAVRIARTGSPQKGK